jgi:hypothetical protein
MMLPALHLADWRATKDTLHLYSQIRLATTAPRNHWWNVTLYVDVRGLTTRRLHHRGTTFDITIDFIDHALVVRTADGRTKSFGLGSGVPVGDFDARIHAILGELDIDVEIREEPFGLPMTTPFAHDLAHASWDREAIARFGRILDWSDSVFEEFSGWFNGKTSPVHLFWHSLDLAVTRFSGRPARPVEADGVTREAYTHEVISFGFWPGDDNIGDLPITPTPPPSPTGCATSRCRRERGSSRAPARWRSSRTRLCAPQATPKRHCSRSAKAPTRPVPALPAGIPLASSRPGAQPPTTPAPAITGGWAVEHHRHPHGGGEL